MSMPGRMGPPRHRPFSNKKKIMKIGPYAEKLREDKHINKKKIYSSQIYNLLLFEVG